MARHRRIFSVERELVTKAREAALASVQIFNNPQIQFKSELFIVTMNIAWTYLMHAHYRHRKVEYHYHELVGTRKKFDKTKYGAKKAWVLETVLNRDDCPLDVHTKNNLRFLIGVRHEIEHQMTTRIDGAMSAKFQACCLNFNRYIKQLFGDKNGIDKHLSVSLQFSAMSADQVDQLTDYPDLPKHIETCVRAFEESLSEEQFNNQAFAYRVIFIPKLANHKGQADQVIEFIKADSEMASQTNKMYTVIRESEREKFLPGAVVNKINDLGFAWFNMNHHTELWKAKNAKDPTKGFGCLMDQGKSWRWYQKWIDEVRAWCEAHNHRFGGAA